MHLLKCTCFLALILLEMASANLLEFPKLENRSLDFVFTQFAVDQTTGNLYIGAANRLLLLNEHLEILEEVTTGPVLDHTQCTTDFGATTCSDGGTVSYNTLTTDNFNKVLVIDHGSGQLITCGSVFQGTCQSRSLVNLSVVTESPGGGRTDYFVAANSPYQSTVGFLGPGPDGQSVLYIGGTYTGGLVSTVRQAIPAVSSRNIVGRNAFRLTYFDGLTGGTAIHLRREAIEKYPVTYTDGFTVDRFAYFLTYQPENFVLDSTGTLPQVSQNFVTKLVQVCTGDRKFNSYVEVPLRCQVEGGEDFDLGQAISTVRMNGDSVSTGNRLLVGAFVKSGNKKKASASVVGNQSGVCLFRLSDVRKVFTRNVRSCFDGEQKFVGAQFSGRLCTRLYWNITEDYCGQAEQNGPLVGTIPLESSPVIVFKDVTLTSLAATFVDDVIVLFLGSAAGYIYKVALNPDMTYHTVEIIPVDADSSISQGMTFDRNGLYIYAMTRNKVVKVATSNCHRHLTGDLCHSARDPYCGWCFLERRCSTKSSCLDSHLEKRWIGHDNDRHQGMTDDDGVSSLFVSPTRIAVHRSAEVTLRTELLPPLQSTEQYLCIFGWTNLSSVGIVTRNEVLCQIPQPAIQNTLATSEKTDHVEVLLSILSTATNVSFLETNITFYDCSRHLSCTRCTSAPWYCQWCIDSNKCGNKDDIISCAIDVINRTEFCPHLVRPNGSAMVIPADSVTQLRIVGRNFPRSDTGGLHPDYQCLVHMAAPPVVIPATRESSEEVVCEPFLYSYAPEEQEKVASIEVTWKKDFYIDDFYGVSVTIYKCEILASDCSACLSLEDSLRSTKYRCQWCGNRCQHSAICGTVPTSICPLHNILYVFPLSGPLEGGTLVTITGTNLGRSVEQIRNSVSVAGVPCEVLPKQYLVSKRIVCKTGSTTKPRRAKILVSIGNATVSWNSDFKYQKPEVVSISPGIGPIAGGTLITFEGHDLDIGGSFKVLLDFIPCIINSGQRNSTMFVCTTVPVLSTMILEVVIVSDGVSQRTGKAFEYTDNPSIREIFPLAAFSSGGRIITVTGNSFDAIQTIVFHLSTGNLTFDSPCLKVDSSKLHCPSPKIKNETLLPSRSPLTFGVDGEFGRFQVSFTMDGVTSVRNLPLHFPTVKSAFTILQDPDFATFDGGHRVYRGEALILEGQNLNLACGTSEAMVFVGTEVCKVNSMDADTLYCIPPPHQPDALDHNGRKTGDFPTVKVVIGNFVQVLGELEYQGSVNFLNEAWVVGIGVTGGALFTIIVIVLVVYKRKSSEAVRQFRKLQFHLNTMEVNIRNECKQAFAELQTEVSDFTSDLNVIGIPFWDYRIYSHNILFPVHSDYSVLQNEVKGNGERMKSYDNRLLDFKQLLNCPWFLLTFIHTLEEQRNFSIKDRSTIASLLVIVLHDRMNYVTEILKCLLSDLINRSIEKQQAKLMFRRNESVAEKLLTNWLTLCMYDHLRDSSGKALFMLYKAIKHQVEKGPVDAITSEARYALREDRLLQQKIEPKILVISLVVVGNNSSQEQTVCKMLDCDTATQAKEKALDALYLNAPFSCRPSVCDVDLEWESPNRRIIVLNDEDLTTTTNKGWQKINTLGHYRIPDGATLTIVPRRRQDFNLQTHNVMDTSHSPVSSMTPFFLLEEGSKIYHLVKHDDCQNTGRVQKVISEVFLTRLLATKCTLQQYIDDLFVAMLSSPGCSTLPTAIKYLFDFFDSSAAQHNVIDPEVTHIWKSNSLHLRFWIGLIKNPEFVFDIKKSVVIDSCLSTIAQTVMDTCSTQTQTLGKDSPSSKLLFAKDIPRYRQWLSQFYRDIQDLPPVTDQQMSKIMSQHSQTHSADFDSGSALKDLYKYAAEYKYELLEALDNDSFARKLRLGDKFEQACRAVEGNNFY